MLKILVLDFSTDFVDRGRNELFGVVVSVGHGHQIQSADSGLLPITDEYNDTLLFRVLLDSKVDLFLHGQQPTVLVILIKPLDGNLEWNWSDTGMEVEHLDRSDPFGHIFVIRQTGG